MSDAAVDEQTGSCSHDCDANRGGPCAEGHEPIDCPYWELTDAVEETPVVPPIRRVALPDGEALRSTELERVTRSCPTSIVVPLGRVRAGKTTLIALSY